MIAGGNSVIARIAKILIKGSAAGTIADATDHVGFVVAQIDAVNVAGTKLRMSRGAGNDLEGLLVGSTGDLTVREVVQARAIAFTTAALARALCGRAALPVRYGTGEAPASQTRNDSRCWCGFLLKGRPSG